MVEWSCTKKEKMKERRSHIFVEWSCANERYILMKTLISGRMSCTKEIINERRPYIFVEWLYTKERINEGGPYTFVE